MSKKWQETGRSERPEQMLLRIGKVLVSIGRMAGGTWKISYHLEGVGSMQSYTFTGDARDAKVDAEKKVKKWLGQISGDAAAAIKELG